MNDLLGNVALAVTVGVVVGLFLSTGVILPIYTITEAEEWETWPTKL